MQKNFIVKNMAKSEIFLENKSILSVSVIIPTFNEEKYIKKCLESIKQQSMSPTEIILVDSGSGDRTLEIAAAYADGVIGTERGTIGRSRNIGAGLSSGDIFIFVDADIILDKDFIGNTISYFEDNKNVGAVSGIFSPLKEDNILVNRLIVNFLINGLAKFSLWIKRPHVTGGAFAVKKDIFGAAGGFNESLQTAEDTEIFRKISKLTGIALNGRMKAGMSMRRFKGLDWLYDWVLGSIYYEITGKSMVVDYKAKR